jgi:hypothetical protein
MKGALYHPNTRDSEAGIKTTAEKTVKGLTSKVENQYTVLRSKLQFVVVLTLDLRPLTVSSEQ